MKWFAALLILTLKVTGFVRDGSVEIIFPQAIQFSVNLTIPATQLTSTSLTITPEGQAPIIVNVDVKKVSLVYGEPQARLVYIWQMPVAHLLPLFGNIAYTWSFTASDGSTGTLDDSFVFADPRVDWVRSLDPQEHFNVTAPRSLSPLLDELKQVRMLLETNTGHPLEDNLLLYPLNPECTPSPTDPNATIARGQDGATVICNPGIEDALFTGFHTLVLPSDFTAEDFVVGTLVPEAYASLWEDKSVPAWFSGGLAQFYAPTPKNLLLPVIQQAMRDGTLFSLDDLSVHQASTVGRAQSFGMVLYIVHQIGVQNLFDLARVNASDFNTAYQQAMNQPLSALIPAWQQWIFTQSAASDYGITPYQPPTSIPTITLTPSVTPTVTSTPTLTPTITPTFTDTPLGFRTTYIPPPTVTSSATYTPLPPSVTPRPPGSLPTFTPAPTALQATVDQPGVQAGVATFLVLLLLLLVFLFFRLGNRR